MPDVFAVPVTSRPAKAGEFKLSAGDASLIFCCPCGCGEVHEVVIDRSESPGPRWHWNRNREKPSLVPSIKLTSGCLWDGFLVDGVFKTCGG